MQAKYIVGVDEVGRGPLAGPVAVGIVMMEYTAYDGLRNSGWFVAGKDSKKLTEKKRDLYFRKIKELKELETLRYGVFFESNEIIDQWGIAGAIKIAIKKGFHNLSCVPDETEILLDGGLKAPQEFIHQRSIIKGDESELIIALASISAKVSRDSKMDELGELETYRHYDWLSNKGYGTSKHIAALKLHGPCDLHRRTFIRNFV